MGLAKVANEKGIHKSLKSALQKLPIAAIRMGIIATVQELFACVKYFIDLGIHKWNCGLFGEER